MMKAMAKEEAQQKGLSWPVKGKEEQAALFNSQPEEPIRRAEDPPFERKEDDDEDENL
jgi:hypothetical protein